MATGAKVGTMVACEFCGMKLVKAIHENECEHCGWLLCDDCRDPGGHECGEHSDPQHTECCDNAD